MSWKNLIELRLHTGLTTYNVKQSHCKEGSSKCGINKHRITTNIEGDMTIPQIAKTINRITNLT